MAITDIIDLLEERAAVCGERLALVWEPVEGPSRTWTYRQFLADIRSVAAQLTARGVTDGDRVILHAENSPEFLLTWFACAWLGAVCVVTNPKSAGPELAYFAEHTDAVGAVTQPPFAETLRGHCSRLQWLLVAEDGRFEGRGGVSHAASPASPPRAVMAARELGSMMFTSGTTSRPKAVVWSRANALWAARSGVRNAGLTADDVAMVFVPLYHVVGLAWSALPAIAAGAAIVLQPRFSASRFWPVAQRHRATFASHVQFSSGVLSRMPAPDSHSFRLWGNSTYLPEYESHFGVPLMGWWGMTEVVAPGIVGGTARPQQAGTIGRAAPGYDVRIVDEAGNPAAPGTAGELLLRGVPGETLFSGYFANPEATAEAFTPDGWFRTGDRMKMHEDGSLQFVERARDVIKTGGEGVSPAEVERTIRAVPGVADAALVGRSDTVYGEVGVAFVVPAEGQSPHELQQAVLDHCRAELAGFKVPREVRLIEALPRAGLNKIAKGELRRIAAGPTVPAGGSSSRG